ncbi:MAG: hypothetical protein JWP89_4548 [Schlesneria sp.]|nr:hypothetical protein [Schlesneria sp.]
MRRHSGVKHAGFQMLADQGSRSNWELDLSAMTHSKSKTVNWCSNYTVLKHENRRSLGSLDGPEGLDHPTTFS